MHGRWISLGLVVRFHLAHLALFTLVICPPSYILVLEFSGEASGGAMDGWKRRGAQGLAWNEEHMEFGGRRLLYLGLGGLSLLVFCM